MTQTTLKQTAMKLEELTKAGDGATFAWQDLRETLHHASTTEALVLLPLIDRAAQLMRDIAALKSAIASDASESR